MLDNFGHVIKHDLTQAHMLILCVTFDFRLSKGHVHNIDMDE